MNIEQFRLLKDRLYRAKNALQLSLQSCPELQHASLKLADGHTLTPGEIICWLEAVRANCWKHGPPEIQQRYLKSLLRDQPQG